MVLVGLCAMQFEVVQPQVEQFKQSMDGFSRLYTGFIATIHSDPDVSIILSVSAVIGAVFNKRKIVTFEWHGGRLFLDNVQVRDLDITHVLLLEFAQFQATTLKAVQFLEQTCTANNLLIMYTTPTDQTSYTISVQVYRGPILQFTVHVKQNPSMRSPDFKTVILDVNNTRRDLLDFNSFVNTTDLFFQTHEYTFPSRQIGQQETSQLWHAVGKLATLVDKLV